MEQIWILIPLSGIWLGPLMYWMHLKEKRIGATSELAAEKATQYTVRMSELEERLKVLERIVTDGGYETAAQIEALRAPSLTQGSKVQ